MLKEKIFFTIKKYVIKNIAQERMNYFVQKKMILGKKIREKFVAPEKKFLSKKFYSKEKKMFS